MDERRDVLRAGKLFAATPLVTILSAREAGGMDITRNGSRPSGKGPAEWFTGTVRIDPSFDASAPARAAGSVDWLEHVAVQEYLGTSNS
jgi:hypothetical protein